jgi:DAK2 domain fusion protein YloV
VFPVADGDTGTNMLLTVRGVVEKLELSGAADRAALADEAAEAALRGAQGNSGVILAEALRGALGVLRGSDDLAAAFRAASDAAYGAVREPREGTMLTVLRELAEEAEAGGDLTALVARGDECVTRTTDLLEPLREAGVVDAGAAGVVELVRGAAGVVLGTKLPAGPERRVQAVHLTPSRFRFCTAFLLEGEDLDPAALERELAPLGDSLLVVGGGTLLKAHVHTDEPERALAAGRARGAVSGVTVADMHEQARAREERLRTPCAAVTVAPGAGNRRLFESLGAIAVGEPTEVAHAVEAADADEVLVLANGADVGLWPHLLAIGSIPEGLSAMVAFDPTRPAEENLAAMHDAAARVIAGAVAARDGAFVGLVAGHELETSSSFDEVALSVVERLLAERGEVLTLLTGDEQPVLDGVLAAVAARHPGVECEVHDGGQPGYPLLLSAE